MSGPLPGSPPLVHVPEPPPRQVRLGTLLAGTTGVFLVFGALFAGSGSIAAVAVLLGVADGPAATAALVSVLCAVVGAVLLVVAVPTLQERRRLYAAGTYAVGRVTSVEPTSIRINNRPVLRTRYEFAGPSGPVEGSVTHTKAPPVGAQVSVLFDPANPNVSLLPLPGAFGRPSGGA